VETTRKFGGEEDVGQLGLLVPAEAAIGVLGVKVVERDSGALMSLRGGRDDARGHAGLEPLQQSRGEQKWREVIDGPGPLDPVLRRLACHVHGAGVVNEDIEPWVASQHLGR
jgi:hypothetical protein